MDWFIVLHNEELVRSFEPDLADIATKGMRGLSVSAHATSASADFVSRFFAPQSGVPEDSVTGSMHCGLACLWEERLGKSQLTGYQASRRGGTVEVLHVGDRVHLTGHARIVVEGKLCR